MPKIDIAAAPTRFGAAYPPPFDTPCAERKRWKLGDAVGLSQFGVSLMRLPPGVWTSQRHWHTAEDELVWVVSGEVVLVENDGETVLRAGDCAAFKAGVSNGHQIQNRAGAEAVLLEIGSRMPDVDHTDYPDLDMVVGPDEVYRRRDGTPYDHDQGRKR